MLSQEACDEGFQLSLLLFLLALPRLSTVTQPSRLSKAGRCAWRSILSVCVRAQLDKTAKIVQEVVPSEGQTTQDPESIEAPACEERLPGLDRSYRLVLVVFTVVTKAQHSNN